jgi:hypothetical protein
MQRTTIVLPPELKSRATERARAMGISFGELARQALERMLDAQAHANSDEWSNLPTYAGRYRSLAEARDALYGKHRP